eukprot:1727621-Pleurochrysis_carterae.AAC.1
MHLAFVVWRVCVGSGTVTVETGTEVTYSAQRWLHIVRESKSVLLEWHESLGGDAAHSFISPMLLSWAQQITLAPA